MVNDFATALGRMRRQPQMFVFTAVSFGLGMSLAMSVVSMIDALVVQSPFAGSSLVMRVDKMSNGLARSTQYLPARYVLALETSSERLDVLVSAMRSTEYVLLGPSGEAASEPTVAVTPEYFSVIGVPPLLGRGLLEEDAMSPESPNIVITYRLWRSRFAGDPTIVERPTLINGRIGRIVGVMPDGFEYPRGVAVWVPIAQSVLRSVAANPDTDWDRYGVLLRQRGAVNASALTAKVRAVISVADQSVAGPRAPPPIRVLSLDAAVRRDNAAEVALWVAFAGLIAALCGVNFATMSLARGIARRQELAVRTALGARPWQLARLLVTDALLIGVLAAVIAVATGTWLGHLISYYLPSAQGSDLGHRPVTILAGALVTVAFGGVFALVPSIELIRSDLRPLLASRGQDGDLSGAIKHGRMLLVGLELMLAVLCLASVISISRSEGRASASGPGYDFEQVLTGSIGENTTGPKVTDEAALLRLVGAQPGVAVAGILNPPAARGGFVELNAISPGSRPFGPYWVDATPGFFKAVALTPLEGRLPTESESVSRARVVILSQRVARWLFPQQSAVGQRVQMKGWGGAPLWLDVIGVVPDINRGPDFGRIDPLIYTMWGLPLDSTGGRLFVRTASEPSATFNSLRRRLAAGDMRAMVSDFRMVRSDVERWDGRRWQREAFLGAIGVLSLLLAAVGIYGVMNYMAESKAREICVRRALGASTMNVLSVTFRRLVAVSIVGLAVGAFLAPWMVRSVDVLLREPSRPTVQIVHFSLAPTALAIAALLIAAVAGALVPASRALRNDIAAGLRNG